MKKRVTINYKNGEVKAYAGKVYKTDDFYICMFENELNKISRITIRMYPLDDNVDRVIYRHDEEMLDSTKKQLEMFRSLKNERRHDYVKSRYGEDVLFKNVIYKRNEGNTNRDER